MGYGKKRFQLQMSCGHFSQKEFTLSPGYEDRIAEWKLKECPSCHEEYVGKLYVEQVKRGWPEFPTATDGQLQYAVKIREKFYNDGVKLTTGHPAEQHFLPEPPFDDFFYSSVMSLLIGESRATAWIAKEKDGALDVGKMYRQWQRAKTPTKKKVVVDGPPVGNPEVEAKVVSDNAQSIAQSTAVKRIENLNDVKLPTGSGGFAQHDYTRMNIDASVSVHFRNLSTALTAYIHEADAVVGCVAWMTSKRILDALSEKDCAILVQKEDFLRPDDNGSDFVRRLQASYGKLHCGLNRYNDIGLLLGEGTNVDPVRCVGNCDRENQASERMHHKFMVFCRYERQYVPSRFGNVNVLVPYAVWTGSFNFTDSAARSFENALYVTGYETANQYIQEFRQLYALSEPLEWMSRWVKPQYMIG